MLRIEGLVKSFGALRATDHLDLNVRPGEIHALIGPNGAGKTTLVSQIAGELAPDAGRILMDGRDITAVPVHRRARMGMARTFQISSILGGFSALDNVALAIQATCGHSFHFWRNARRLARLREPAMVVLAQVGLAHRAEVSAARLSHGEQRLVGIAMALAGCPKLLLLDEPLAGMGPASSAETARLLATLKGDHTLLLVEHDMEVVFRLADTVSVLVYGRCIATGTPEQIRRDPAVVEAYLGEGDESGEGGNLRETDGDCMGIDSGKSGQAGNGEHPGKGWPVEDQRGANDETFTGSAKKTHDDKAACSPLSGEGQAC